MDVATSQTMSAETENHEPQRAGRKVSDTTGEVGVYSLSQNKGDSRIPRIPLLALYHVEDLKFGCE